MPPADAALPLQLSVTGRRCVVVGAGRVGARRARSLVDAGAVVLVVGPEPDPAVVELARTGAVELASRPVDDDDLAGAFLVVVATGEREVDERVGASARAAGSLVNRADDVRAGDVAFPAVVRRGPVTLAVSTGGRAPAVARWVAELLDEGVDGLIGLDGQGYESLVEIVDEVRTELRAGGGGGTGVTSGPVDWRSALDRSILDLIAQGRRAEAKERLLACLSSS